MSPRRDLTPGPTPKERGEGHDIRNQPPLSFGEGPGVRSLQLLYPLYVIYFSFLIAGLAPVLSKKSRNNKKL
jgi:hypothetical protein